MTAEAWRVCQRSSTGVGNSPGGGIHFARESFPNHSGGPTRPPDRVGVRIHESKSPLTERRIIQGAFGISLFVHVLFAAVTWKVPFFEVDLSEASPADREVELFLVPDEAKEEAAESTMPRAYTAIPERLATEEPPENPEYLAMHHSIAADNVAGEAGTTPAAEKEWIQPKVALRKEDFDGAEGVDFATQPLAIPESGARPSDPGDRGSEKEAVEGETKGPLGEWAVPDEQAAEGVDERQQEQEAPPELADWWGGQSPSVLRKGQKGTTGDRGFDFNQESRGTVGAGVAIDGDFSLNTYEWDYAPWMKRFENQLHRVWMAPYAYRVGIISGKTVIRLVVQKNGVPSAMEVLETEGHDSLHEASIAALKAFAPYAPLPAHFPEETLVITLGLHYPAWNR